MTPQEQEMLGGLIDRVQKTQLAEKDMDAEQMLRQGLGPNPDALYILAQTVLVQKYALEQAQAQLAQARAQMQHPEPKHATSFLGSLLGRNDAPAATTIASGYPPPDLSAVCAGRWVSAVWCADGNGWRGWIFAGCDADCCRRRCRCACF